MHRLVAKGSKQGIDAAFQLGALASQQLCGDLALPLSVGEISLSENWDCRPLQDVVLHQIERLEMQIKVPELSLYANGEEVVRMRDVTFVRHLRAGDSSRD